MYDNYLTISQKKNNTKNNFLSQMKPVQKPCKDNTKSCYQLIKTITKFEKETEHRLYNFLRKQ